jgi:hypothetical protein
MQKHRVYSCLRFVVKKQRSSMCFQEAPGRQPYLELRHEQHNELKNGKTAWWKCSGTETRDLELNLSSGGSPPPPRRPRGLEAAMAAASGELRGPHPRPCCWSSTAFHRLGRARQLLGAAGKRGTNEHARPAVGGPCVSRTRES